MRTLPRQKLGHWHRGMSRPRRAVANLEFGVYTRIMYNPCHCTRLRTATRKVAAFYDAALAPTGINIAQFALLRTVARRGSLSLTELGRLLGLDRSTMGRNVRVVEKDGLVTIGKGKDQREAVVSLTDQGQAVLSMAEPLWSKSQDELTGRLGPERMELLDELERLL